MTKWSDLFTNRQLVSLTTFSDLVGEAIERIQRDAIIAGLPDDRQPLAKVGAGATAYAEAVGVYLACLVDRMVYYGSSLTTWLPKDNALRDCMPRQAFAMVWDFAEGNPLGKSSGDITTCCNAVASYLEVASTNAPGTALQFDAQSGLSVAHGFVISTDPPYYDNIGYADLSDYFYVWLRRSLRGVFPELFATMTVPKAEELVATPYRHGGKEKAEQFFLDGMTQAMHRLAEQAHPAYPVTIYYAFKQSENDDDEGTTNTGWDTFLAAVIEAGFSITGTWPMRTEGEGRMIASGTNALASSIVLVCRPRPASAQTTTRREFHNLLKTELPAALAYLQAGNIAPVDLAQAAIGPGMAVYTRFASVLDAEGKPLPVRAALALINQVLDEALAEQEGDFDADTRWALAWFEQIGFDEGEYGVAEQLSKAKNTAVSGLVEAGIAFAGKGKVRLVKPAELPADWDPTTDTRLTVWEMVHHLVRMLEAGGESATALLVAKLGSQAEIARELCYRLYTICERKKRASEAMAYNALVQSWPEITRLAREAPRAATPGTDDLFE
jgi:putative DNA methylase